MKIRLYTIAGILSAALAAFGQQVSLGKAPETPKRPVIDEYQGIKVTDEYRWLENWEDSEVKQWSAAENALSREYLDHLPARAAVKERIKQLNSASSVPYRGLQFRGGLVFAIKNEPSKQLPMLVALRSVDDLGSEKIVFDPNTASEKGSLAIDFYTASLDGKYVAVAASKNGSEDSSALVLEVATGKKLPDMVPRVNFGTAGGSIAWKADSSGFYYTRYPQGSERPPEDANFYQQVYFHKLGADPKQDTYVMGKEFPRIAEIVLRMDDDGHWLVASVHNGDGGEVSHYVMESGVRWRSLHAIAQERSARPDSACAFGSPGSRPGKGRGSTKLGERSRGKRAGID
jgi:prolyl oligopeptidase